MGETFLITQVQGRQILDSRGNPTIEAQITVDKAYTGRAAVPSGASTGQFEAVEVRAGEKAYGGLGVTRAAAHINGEIRQELLGKDVRKQKEIDQLLKELDGTPNKGRLGANAILGASLACARAAARTQGQALYKYLGQQTAYQLPVPMMNILNGGKHAKNTVDFQEFMIMPVGAGCFSEALEMGTSVYHQLKKLLAGDGKSTAVGDEGGFAPDLKDAFEVFDYLTKAVEEAGYTCGKDIVFAMDAAASELFQPDAGQYYFPGESQIIREERIKDQPPQAGETVIGVPDTERIGVMRTTKEMIDLYEQLCSQYPIYSIEDGLDEEDWEGWKELTERLGKRVQLVGDDLFVTNTTRLKKGISAACANSILIKPNQIGTLSETVEAVRMAHEAGYTAVMSHRSGETEDTTIADLAVALSCGQIKTGAPCRTDRVAKYNQLLRIEEELGEGAQYPGVKAFRFQS